MGLFPSRDFTPGNFFKNKEKILLICSSVQTVRAAVVNITLSRPLHVYHAALKLRAELSGVRYLLYYWFFASMSFFVVWYDPPPPPYNHY